VRRITFLFALCVMLAACEPPPTPPVMLHPAGSPPALLSEWRLMSAEGSRLVLNGGVMPYELNSPLFSDYALKLRTVWTPTGTFAVYNEDRELEFPVGTVISKTFHYEKLAEDAGVLNVRQRDGEAMLENDGTLDLDTHVLIETRLLVRYDDGWKAFPYVWNASQDDATLEIAGDQRDIVLVNGNDSQQITYIVPDANQCAGCHVTDHTAKELRPIGPQAWQLNRPFSWWGNPDSQLTNWSKTGMLGGYGGTAPEGVRWSDPGDATLQQRARAYLDANCAHCHNPRGAADTSALHLNLDAPLDRLYGICKTPVAVGRGSGDRPFDIYPGRPQDSILLFRMQHTDPAIAMPELGRSAIHAEGVELVSNWIASMNGEC
jgi:uncharacterized repeat protein (TIGR03806 family)